MAQKAGLMAEEWEAEAASLASGSPGASMVADSASGGIRLVPGGAPAWQADAAAGSGGFGSRGEAGGLRGAACSPDQSTQQAGGESQPARLEQQQEEEPDWDAVSPGVTSRRSVAVSRARSPEAFSLLPDSVASMDSSSDTIASGAEGQAGATVELLAASAAATSANMFSPAAAVGFEGSARPQQPALSSAAVQGLIEPPDSLGHHGVPTQQHQPPTIPFVGAHSKPTGAGQLATAAALRAAQRATEQALTAPQLLAARLPSAATAATANSRALVEQVAEGQSSAKPGSLLGIGAGPGSLSGARAWSGPLAAAGPMPSPMATAAAAVAAITLPGCNAAAAEYVTAAVQSPEAVGAAAGLGPTCSPATQLEAGLPRGLEALRREAGRRPPRLLPSNASLAAAGLEEQALGRGQGQGGGHAIPTPRTELAGQLSRAADAAPQPALSASHALGAAASTPLAAGRATPRPLPSFCHVAAAPVLAGGLGRGSAVRASGVAVAGVTGQLTPQASMMAGAAGPSSVQVGAGGHPANPSAQGAAALAALHPELYPELFLGPASSSRSCSGVHTSRHAGPAGGALGSIEQGVGPSPLAERSVNALQTQLDR